VAEAPLDLSHSEGRKRARKELIWGDHGFLRLGFRNLHHIGGGMMRSNQPSPEHLKVLADNGVKTIFQLGQPISEALEQLRLRYLHVRQGKTGMIDFFFEEFLAYEAEGGDLTFLEWVDEIYDPADVKARFMAGWIGSTITEKILRRE